ncbi:lytic transglycosylase [Gammaproteobacteria bacterium]|nr:lytic transglycosylase [Gammaproteobacteria bacterium]
MKDNYLLITIYGIGLLTGLIINKADAQVPPTYKLIGAKYGVDPALMYAVAHVESGKKNATGLFMPWPWTANICDKSPGKNCKGHFFKTREALYERLIAELARGNDWFDVGQVQMNWHFHGNRFGYDLWLATHPLVNLNQAAGLLKELQQRHKSKKEIFAAYHAGSGWKTKARSQARINQILSYANTANKHYTRIVENEIKNEIKNKIQYTDTLATVP